MKRISKTIQRALMVILAMSALFSCSKGPNGLSVSPSSVTVTEGDIVSVTATVSPEGSKYGAITWTSSNESVATVNNGFITGKSAGTATITASTSGVSGSTSVTVKAKPVMVSSIQLDKTSITLTEEETTSIKATVKPDNADDKTVTWSSSDASVVTVNSNGDVKAVKAGNTKIIVTSNDGSAKAECKVTVKSKYVEATSMVISSADPSAADGYKVLQSKTLKLIATVLPENASEKSVTWESEDPSIATVSSSGLVSGIKAGTTTITVRLVGNSKLSASCRIIVEEYSNNSGLGNGGEIIIKN